MAKIVFWLGPSPELWDPLTALDTGIGGSETAAIHMANQLTLLGHEVVVYANCPSQFIDADEDGKFPNSMDVEWVNYQESVVRNLDCDVFVSSRTPMAKRMLMVKCKQAWLWMHDLHCGPDWDNVIGTDHDKVLCLSAWARDRFLSYYTGVEAEKVVVTSNGLDMSRFEDSRLRPGDQHLPGPKMERLPLRVTWSSSPDRGLDRLLDMWPKIYDVYGAGSTLHVYYGFDTWKRLADLHGLTGDLHRIHLLESRLASMTSQGVIFHGRVGQQEIAESYLRSQLWLYPTTFEEVSCITAMEAQAAGCKIVASRWGALPETAPGAWFVDPVCLPINGRQYEQKFLESVHEAMIEDTVQITTPRSWQQVAEEWNQRLMGDVTNFVGVGG